MPDDYLSAQEPSEFEYDSEEMDPESLRMTRRKMMPPKVPT